MAVDEVLTAAVDNSIPAGCYRQPTEGETLSDVGEIGFSYILKGPDGELATLAHSITSGTVLVAATQNDLAWIAKGWQLQRGNGNTGTLTVSCTRDAGQTTGTTPEAKPLKETWTLHAVRNDVSAMRYCGESAANPQRADIEMWLKETDKTLSDGYQYNDDKGEIQDLSDASVALAEKLRRGVQSVMRFYPVLSRRRIYSSPPPGILDDLSYIDTPPTPTANTEGTCKFPASLTTKLDSYQWLKCQDDCDEQADGTWVRTESWMGILKADDPTGNNSPWDPDLYGASRWKFPAFPLENSNNTNNPGGSS